jgi:hypothetical protein
METDFWLQLVAQVNKYVASTKGQNDTGSSNSGMESKWFDTTVDELMTFISLSINYASRKVPFKHNGMLVSPLRLYSFPQKYPSRDINCCVNFHILWTMLHLMLQIVLQK